MYQVVHSKFFRRKGAMHLDRYDKGNYTPGAPFLYLICWYLIGCPLLRSRVLFSSRTKRLILRLFGARIGRGVILKPGLRVKFPWRLSIEDWSWIGEDVWIDNLAAVSIGSHCCISQGVYICTGNHRWSEDSFCLDARPIRIESHSWIGAKSCLGPGVTVREGAVVTLASVATQSLDAWTINQGNPAKAIGVRKMRDSSTRESQIS